MIDELAQRRWLMKSYGTTLEEYNTMLAHQAGVCAICGESEKLQHRSGTRYSLAVDHDHRTGKVRGLLCHRCNVAIGLFQENSLLLRKASLYLEGLRLKSYTEYNANGQEVFHAP